MSSSAQAASGDPLNRPKWWVLATLGMGPVILFFPTLFLGKVLFWGTPMLQFVPWRQFALQTVRAGHLPLWNPLVGLGAPLLANYQSALLYPPNWLQAVVGVVPGQSWLIVLHLAWTGLGMWVLARRLGFTDLASLVAGLCFSLSTYLVGRSGFLSINAAVAWVPWVIAGVDRLAVTSKAGWLKSGDRWAYVWTVAALALQWLAGHAQIAWYTLLLAVVWLVWRALHHAGTAGLIKAISRLGLAGAAAVCLTAPQLLPTLAYLSISQRASSVGRELAMTYSFWPWHLLGLLTPDLFGSPASGDYWGYGNYWEDAIYVGVLPACMAVAAGWRAIRGRGPIPATGRFLLGLSGVSVVLALGWNTPLYPWLYDWAPTFSLFQAPARWTLWLVFSLALLAGMGVDGWRPARDRGLYWLRLGTAGGVAVVLGAGLAAVGLRGIHSTFIRSVGMAGFWLVLTGALGLVRRPNPGFVWAGAVALVVGLDLVVAGWGLNPVTDSELYRAGSVLTAQVKGDGRIYMAPDIEYAYKYDTVFRFDSFQPGYDFFQVRQVGLADANMLDGVASVNNFDPILPGRYEAVMAVLPGLSMETQAHWLTAMDVELAATASDPAGRPVLRQLPAGRRAWFVDRVQFAANETEALQQALTDGFDPTHTAVIEGLTETLVPLRPGAGHADWLATDDPNRMGLTTASSTGGWVVISASYDPGWSASVDGRATQLCPADGMLMAVWVPPGDHTLWLEYGSRPLLIGLAAAVLGLAAAGALWRWG
jgi:hypothetical protein